MTRRRQVPGDSCFWALIDAPPRLDDSAIGFAVEDSIPVPIEGLALAWTALPNGRVLACAITVDRLQAAIAEPGIWSLGPDSLPACLVEHHIPAPTLERIDFLSGRHRSPARRRWQTALLGAAATMALVALLLIQLGYDRRIDHVDRATAQLAEQELLLLGDSFPDSPADPTLLHARLTMALREQEQQSRLHADEDQGIEPAQILQTVSEHWPEAFRCRIDTLSTTRQRFILRGETVDLDSAQLLHSALKRLEIGRQLLVADALQASRNGATIRFAITLRLSRKESQ